MPAAAIAVLTFVLLLASAFASMAVCWRLPARYRGDDTTATIRVVGNLFVVVTSLVLGLTINSATQTFHSIDRNVHSFATDIVLLDRILRTLGPQTGESENNWPPMSSKH